MVSGRDKERMALLLEINTHLLKEVCDLQAQGKAGHVGGPPQKEDGKPGEGENKQGSKEFIEYDFPLFYLPVSQQKRS